MRLITAIVLSVFVSGCASMPMNKNTPEMPDYSGWESRQEYNDFRLNGKDVVLSLDSYRKMVEEPDSWTTHLVVVVNNEQNISWLAFYMKESLSLDKGESLAFYLFENRNNSWFFMKEFLINDQNTDGLGQIKDFLKKEYNLEPK